MSKHQEKFIRKIRLITILLFFTFIFGGYFLSRPLIKTYGKSELEAKPTPTKKVVKTKPTPQPVKSKYSDFKHNTHINLKLECNSCHKFPSANWEKVRSKDTAFPDITDYPKHESCLNCHRQQFFSGKPPAICSNCHKNPSPMDSSRFPFQNPRELFDASTKAKYSVGDFQVAFPHDKHVEIVSRNENFNEIRRNGVAFVNTGYKKDAEASCKVCHQTYLPQGDSADEYFSTPPKDLGDNFWLKKGTFKTAPIGHTVCFTCHSTETGMSPTQVNCATCHKLKQQTPTGDFDANLANKIGVKEKVMLDIWNSRHSAGVFRHEFQMHADMSCNTCHNYNEMNTADYKTKKVPVLSCSPCHITATTADGGVLNAEVDSKKKDDKFICVKCHITYGKQTIPDSHLKAIEAQK